MDTSMRRAGTLDRDSEAFNPKEFTMPGATERDVAVFKEMFDLLDADDNGMLTPSELRSVMIHYGYNPKKQVIYQMVSDLDTDESGGVDFYEFMKMMTSKPCENDSDSAIEDVFNMYDADRKGYITLEDLQRIAKEMNEVVKDEDLKEIIEKVDSENKDRISFKAWMNFMKKKDYAIFASLKL